MILHTQTPVVDETDGLPLPHRIWAVVGISFALCMSVLDINIINVVLPTLSHDFGTSPQSRPGLSTATSLPLSSLCFHSRHWEKFMDTAKYFFRE